MKSLATKLFAVIFIVILAAGCASSITAPQDLEKDQAVVKKAQGTDGITAGSDMQESVERPEWEN